MAYYNSTIQQGSKGSDVKAWQEFLQSQGYDFSAYGGIDGIFGEGTLKYTKEWQKKNKLSETGIVDANTWSIAGFKDMNTPVSAPNNIGSIPTAPTLDYTPWLDTTEGQSANKAREDAEAALKNHGDFNYLNQEWMNQVLSDIKNRKEFSYNLDEDALYQQYKDKYIKQGKMAMEDTIGQASAMTGGYGNSYAQSVGHQAYQASLENLNDIVPELYQMAYDKYNNETQDLYNQYGLLLQDYAREYGEHSDEYNKLLTALQRADSNFYQGADMYNTEQSMANSVAQNNFQNQLSIWDAKNTEAWNQAQWDEAARQFAYQQYLAESGYSSSGSSSGGSSGGYYSSGSGDLGGDLGGTNSSVSFSSVEEKVASMTSNKERGEYIAELEVSGAITSAEATYLKGAYNNPYEVDMGSKNPYTKMANSSNGWKVKTKGGGNLLGIDRDAVVITPNGEEITLRELRDKLKKEGLSLGQANETIIALQNELGISSNWVFGL